MSVFPQDVTYITIPTGSNLINELCLHFYQNNIPITLITNDDQQALILYELNNYFNSAKGRIILKEQEILNRSKVEIKYTTMLLSFKFTAYDPVIIIDAARVNETLLSLFISKWKEQKANHRLILINRSSKHPNTITFEQNNAPVTIYYHTQNYEPNNINLFPTVVQILNNFITSANSLTNNGHILIFVANNADIETLTSLVKNLENEHYDVIGLNSATLIKSLYTRSKRKIIITTDSYSSLLILDKLGNINGVIDTMFTVEDRLTQSGGIRRKTQYISKPQAIIHQQWVGQKVEGFCYRLCTQKLYDTLPNKNNKSKNKIILELIETGTLTANNIDSQLLSTVTLLSKLELIKISDGYYSLTESGSFVLNLPFSVRNGLALYYSIQQSYPIFPILCIIAMLDSYGPYFIYLKRDPGISQQEYNLILQEHTERFFKRFFGISDLHTITNIWVTFLNEVGGLQSDALKSWSRLNSLNETKLREVFNIISSCLTLLSSLGYKYVIGPFETINTIDNLRPILAKVYQDEIVRRQPMSINRPIYMNINTSKIYLLQNFSGLYLNPPSHLIPLLTTEVFNAGSFITYIAIGLDYNISPDPIDTSNTEDMTEPSLPDSTVSNIINSPVSSKVMGPLLYLQKHLSHSENDTLIFD